MTVSGSALRDVARRAMLLAIALAVVAGCSSGHPAPKAISVTVNLELTDSTSYAGLAPGATCSGEGGYSDIAPTTNVTVTNQSGTIIAAAPLGAGTFNGTVCDFSTSFAVPKGATFYGFTVSHRGTITDSAAQLAAADNTVTMTLGSD